MTSACGISSTAINPLGARQIQSIALTTRAAVEMKPASVESSTGWEPCVLGSTRGSSSITTRWTPTWLSGGYGQSGAGGAEAWGGMERGRSWQSTLCGVDKHLALGYRCRGMVREPVGSLSLQFRGGPDDLVRLAA